MGLHTASARRARWLPRALFPLAAMTASSFALAGAADVLSVDVRDRGGAFDFSVTIRSADTGWDYYCDRFELVAPDGRVLGTRVLLHPHVDEQPFTRSLSGVRIPDGVGAIEVRARMKPDGAGGSTVRLSWPPPR